VTEKFAVEKLRRDHPVDDFESAQPQLDLFLIRYALTAQQDLPAIRFP
jgi:hypothetical protein